MNVVKDDGFHDENWFKFEPGTGKFAQFFRLRNYENNNKLSSRTEPEPLLVNYPGDVSILEDQYSFFDFEDMKIDRVEYEINQTKMLDTLPKVIGRSTQRNDTDVNQTVEFDFSRTVTNTSTFDYKLGFNITVGASGNVGIPFIAEGEVKVEASNSHDFSWGTTKSESVTFSARFPATTPPHHKVIATATVIRHSVYSLFKVSFFWDRGGDQRHISRRDLLGCPERC